LTKYVIIRRLTCCVVFIPKNQCVKFITGRFIKKGSGFSLWPMILIVDIDSLLGIYSLFILFRTINIV